MEKKIDFLKNLSWQEVSREERFFCAELYYTIQKYPKPFLELLGIDTDKNFDVGYEVCFYRDVLSAYGKPVRTENLPLKRTFDLALLSDEEIYIIEAKAQQGFEKAQMKDFEKDKNNIKRLFEIIGKKCPKVYVCALISSYYKPKKEIKEKFHKTITWQEVAKVYNDSTRLFERANEIYPHK